MGKGGRWVLGKLARMVWLGKQKKAVRLNSLKMLDRMEKLLYSESVHDDGGPRRLDKRSGWPTLQSPSTVW